MRREGLKVKFLVTVIHHTKYFEYNLLKSVIFHRNKYGLSIEFSFEILQCRLYLAMR